MSGTNDIDRPLASAEEICHASRGGEYISDQVTTRPFWCQLPHQVIHFAHQSIVSTSSLVRSFPATMLFKSLALTAALAVSVSTHVTPRGDTRSCGTPRPSEAQVEASRQMLENERARVAEGVLRSERTIKVDTYFHVIAASESVEDGYATVCRVTCRVPQIPRTRMANSDLGTAIARPGRRAECRIRAPRHYFQLDRH